MSIPFIEGVEEIVDSYDYFILDIFGVIHDGIRPFEGTVNALKMLQSMGKRTCLLSNSPRRVSGATGQMEMMGIPRSLYDHAVTSGEATYLALKNRDESLGDDCWFIGTEGVSEILHGLDLNIVSGPEDASFILNSIPGTEASAVESGPAGRFLTQNTSGRSTKGGCRWRQWWRCRKTTRREKSFPGIPATEKQSLRTTKTTQSDIFHTDGISSAGRFG